MNVKKTTKKTQKPDVTSATESINHNGQPGYLAKLKLIHRDHELPIRTLSACQIRRKHADPVTVVKYAELLQESEPPSIIVIVDSTGRNFIADGHNRTAAAFRAGRAVIKADVYAGTVADAKIIGLQANQHGLALSLSERKAALDELLNTDDHSFTDSDLARMTGLDRHTVERRRRERQSGDFIAAAGKIRRVKTPEELMTQAANTFIAEVERHGQELVLKTLELLPSHIREDVTQRLVSAGCVQEGE